MKRISEIARDIAKGNDWQVTREDHKLMRWADDWERKVDLVTGTPAMCKFICRQAKEAMGEDEQKMKRWVVAEYMAFPLAVQKSKEMISLYFKIKNQKSG